jgi:hypothetical protein
MPGPDAPGALPCAGQSPCGGPVCEDDCKIDQAVGPQAPAMSLHLVGLLDCTLSMTSPATFEHAPASTAGSTADPPSSSRPSCSGSATTWSSTRRFPSGGGWTIRAVAHAPRERTRCQGLVPGGGIGRPSTGSFWAKPPRPDTSYGRVRSNARLGSDGGAPPVQRCGAEDPPAALTATLPDLAAAPLLLLHAPHAPLTKGSETIDKVCRYLPTDPNCPCNYLVSQAAELVRFAFDAQPGETTKYTSFDMGGVWERRLGYRETQKARGSTVEKD